jgi:hypothetical protein
VANRSKPSRERVEAYLAAIARNHGNRAAAAREVGEKLNTAKDWLDKIEGWYGIKYEPQKVGAGTIRVRVQAAPVPTPAPQPVERTTERPKVRVAASNAPMRVLAIGDAHDSPKLPKDRFAWMGRHAAETRPSHIVQIGDLLTLDSLNSHESNASLGGKAKPAYLADMVSGKEALDAFNSQLPTDYAPNRHITLGNHEQRILRFEADAPETVGMMRSELESILSDAGWTWSEYGEFHYLGGVAFVHVPLNRMGKPYGGKNSEQQIANDSVTDTIFGHSHIGRQWRAPKIGPAQHVTVLNLGCALPEGHIEDYARLSTTGWTFGIYDLTIGGGHILSASFVPMAELERRYGKP